MTEPTMRVEFDADLDDYVDVATRSLRRSDAALPFYQRARVLGGMITASILFITLQRIPVLANLLMAALGFAVGAVVFPWYRAARFKHDAARLYREWLGDSGLARIQLEPRAPGLWVAQKDTEVLYPWHSIVSVGQADEDVDIAFKYDGLVIVRARAFRDAAHQAEFLRVLNNYRTGAAAPAS